jgi:DNA-directed RNA polymerase subunit RPC12/RpoP
VGPARCPVETPWGLRQNISRDFMFPQVVVELLWVGRMTMSTYVFLRQDCNKEFTQTLHMAEVKKIAVVCPHCGGKRVVQAVAAFSAVTAKKS